MARIMTVERDVRDWLLYAVTAVAAVTAIVVFLAWAAELRRRPEIRFYWRLSPDGDPAHLAIWSPDHVPEIKATQPFLVEAAIQNTGDKAGRDTLINFVVPDCFDLRRCAASAVEPPHASNDTAGLPLTTGSSSSPPYPPRLDPLPLGHPSPTAPMTATTASPQPETARSLATTSLALCPF